MNIKKMVNENYRQREFEFGGGYDSGNSGLENTASESRTKKKSNALRNWVIAGVVAGGLVYGGYKGLEIVDEIAHGFGGTWEITKPDGTSFELFPENRTHPKD